MDWTILLITAGVIALIGIGYTIWEDYKDQQEKRFTKNLEELQNFADDLLIMIIENNAKQNNENITKTNARKDNKREPRNAKVLVKRSKSKNSKVRNEAGLSSK